MDFTHALAGPYATMILGDMGADVVKVENPKGGDRTRRYIDMPDGFSSYFGSVNHGKRSVVLDLKRPEGLDLAQRMASAADVVTINYGPGVAEKLGLSYEDLSMHNPRLIYASVSGYGKAGSWKDRIGVDPAIQALSGSMTITGEPDGPPVRVGYSITDLAGGVFLAVGVLAALHERQSSGRGQSLDISLLEAQLALMENAAARYLHSGDIPSALGSQHPYQVLTQAYRASDGWLVIGFGPRRWKEACEGLDKLEWLDDPIFAEPEKNRDVVEPALRQLVAAREREFWINRFERLGVLCAPVNTIAQALELPPVTELGFISETVDGAGRSQRIVGSPVKLDRTPPRPSSAAPLLGQHTHECLSEWLGLTDAELQQLDDEGLFQSKPYEIGGLW